MKTAQQKNSTYRSRLSKFIVLGITTVVGGSLLFSCTRFGDLSNEEKAEKVAGKVGWHLDMNDEQEAQVEVSAKKVLGYFDVYKQNRNETLEIIKLQIQAEQMNTQELIKLYEDRKAKMDEIMPKLLTEIAAVHKTLNTKQREKLVSYIEKKQKNLKK